MTGFIPSLHRRQQLLLPELLDDYVSEENPVRFIDTFVDGLDLRKMGFAHAEPNDVGRPPYNPGDLLKLYLYGYLNRVRSSRRLERECQRNLEVIWLMRKLTPCVFGLAEPAFSEPLSSDVGISSPDVEPPHQLVDRVGNHLALPQPTQ